MLEWLSFTRRPRLANTQYGCYVARALLQDDRLNSEKAIRLLKRLGVKFPIKNRKDPEALRIQVPSQKVIGDYSCRLGGPKYLLRRYLDP